MKKILFLFLLIVGISENSVVFGETALRKNAVEWQPQDVVKKKDKHRKKLKKQRKKLIFFRSIKQLCSKNKSKVETHKYLIWSAIGALALLIGGIAQFYPFYAMGFIVGVFSFLVGLIIFITGNGDWNVTIGFILAIASIVVPYILLIRSFD